jgi:hypothetical protein
VDGYLADGAVLIFEDECPADASTGVVSSKDAADMSSCDFGGGVRHVAAGAGHGRVREHLKQCIGVADSQRFED